MQWIGYLSTEADELNASHWIGMVMYCIHIVLISRITNVTIPQHAYFLKSVYH